MIRRIKSYYITNKDRVHRLSKESGWILIGQITSVMGTLLIVRVLTQYLAPAEYGDLALGLTLAGLVNQVALGGVTSGIGRFYSVAIEKGDLWGYLRAAKRLMIYATFGVVCIAAALLAGLVAIGQTHWLGLTAAVLIFSVLSGYNSAFSGIQNAARQRAVVAIHSGVDAWLRIGLSILFMRLLGTTSMVVVISYALTALFVMLSQIYFLKHIFYDQRSSSRYLINEDWANQIWFFSWPMMVSGLFNWGYYASQRWALQLFVSTAEVGKFYALTQIAYTPILLGGSLFLSLITPILYARGGDLGDQLRLKETYRTVHRSSIVSLFATFILAFISLLLHKMIFNLFLAPGYQVVSIFMPIMVMAAGFMQVSITMGSIASINNQTSKILPLAIFGNFVIALMNLFFTSKWAITGLVFSILIGSLIHLIWMSTIVYGQTKSLQT